MTVLFLPAGAIFGVIVDRAWPTMELVYGPLAVATLPLVWSWYVALITLVGAALASQVKTMRLEGYGATATKLRQTGEAGEDGEAGESDAEADPK